MLNSVSTRGGGWGGGEKYSLFLILFRVARSWQKYELRISPWYSKARVDHCEHLAKVPNQANNLPGYIQTGLKHLFTLQHCFQKKISILDSDITTVCFAGQLIVARVKLPSMLKTKFLIIRSEMNSDLCSLQPSLSVLLFSLRIALTIFTLFIISKQISTLTCWDKTTGVLGSW